MANHTDARDTLVSCLQIWKLRCLGGRAHDACDSRQLVTGCCNLHCKRYPCPLLGIWLRKRSYVVDDNSITTVLW
jgi:hypothetical protein